MSKKIIIVGGVAGGATAAARLRRIDETSTIVLFERGEQYHLQTVDYLIISAKRLKIEISF